jgi:CBS domain-containing protein
MKKQRVKDVMLPLSEYAVVTEETTLGEALRALAEAQVRLQPGRQPHRAVLVRDREGSIVGKLGHLGFLKALEPKYDLFGDVERLARAGVTSELMDMMTENLRFWQDDLEMIRHRAMKTTMKEVMKPVEESIDEDKPITDAMHRMIMWQTLSVLVTRGSEVVGILRLSDLFDTVSEYVTGVGSA